MEYLIFILIVSIGLWSYHRIRYFNSGYATFDYYLTGETNWIIGRWIMLFEIIMVTAIVIGTIYFGGDLVKYVID